MKKWKVMAGMLLLSGMLFISCSNSVKKTEDPTPELRAAWNAFIERWEALDAKGCAAFYSIDGQNIPPELNVNRGREEVEAFYSFLFSMHHSAQYKHQIKSVSFEGNLAVEWGEFHVDWVQTDGTPWHYHARSLTHWERDPEGRWFIKAFIFNTPPA